MEGFDPKAKSQGLGDTIAKFTHATGLDVVADKVAKALGQEDCGCNRRREKLNNLVPYNQSKNIDEYREALNRSSSNFKLPNVFFVHKKITLLLNGELKEYSSGEKVLVENESHPLFAYLGNYINSGHLEKLLDKQKRDYEARQILQTEE